jgi:hypothetical protein
MTTQSGGERSNAGVTSYATERESDLSGISGAVLYPTYDIDWQLLSNIKKVNTEIRRVLGWFMPLPFISKPDRQQAEMKLHQKRSRLRKQWYRLQDLLAFFGNAP